MEVKKIVEVDFMSKDSVFIQGKHYISYERFKNLDEAFGDLAKDMREKITNLEKENRTLKEYIQLFEDRR